MTKFLGLATALSMGLLSNPAEAEDKAKKVFAEGLTDDEVKKLTQPLGNIEARYEEAKPRIEWLKASKEAFGNARLRPLASHILRSYATIGVFLREIQRGLKKKDPRVNSFETELKSEIDYFQSKARALEETARQSHAETLAVQAEAIALLGTGLGAAYVELDRLYNLCLGDVNLAGIPPFNVYPGVLPGAQPEPGMPPRPPPLPPRHELPASYGQEYNEAAQKMGDP